MEKVNEITMGKYDQSRDNPSLDLRWAKNTEQIKSQFLENADQNQKKSSGIFSKFTSALKNYIGNKVLTEEDLNPVIDELNTLLLDKMLQKKMHLIYVKVLKKDY